MNGKSLKTPNRSSVLRTTTWGAVIAASLLLAAFGFQGHIPGLGSDANQSASNTPIHRFMKALPSFSSQSHSQANASKKSDAQVSASANANQQASPAVPAPIGPSSTVWGASLHPASRPQVNSQPNASSSG